MNRVTPTDPARLADMPASSGFERAYLEGICCRDDARNSLGVLFGLGRGFRSLSVRQWEVLCLSSSGVEFKEIACALNTSEASVRSSYSLGVAKLREAT